MKADLKLRNGYLSCLKLSSLLRSSALSFFSCSALKAINNQQLKISKLGKSSLPKTNSRKGVKTTESGLQYLVLQEGTGTVYPKTSDKVTVHYHGTLLDGTVFDSSVERGESIQFGLGTGYQRLDRRITTDGRRRKDAAIYSVRACLWQSLCGLDPGRFCTDF